MAIAPNAGYIVFRDKLTVVFYTNDLAGTPSQRVQSGDSHEAIWLCRGLAPLRRWTLDSVLHRKTFHVPAMAVAYNLFMNGVDRRSLINAYSLFKKVAGPKATRVKLRDFKQRVAEQLTAEQRAKIAKERRCEPSPSKPIAEVVGGGDNLHAITPNSRRYSTGKVMCYLCSLWGFTKKALFGCTGCHRGFRVACFSAFHYRHALTPTSLTVRSALDSFPNDWMQTR
ncbi:hypothetical protein F441_03678 [Phytophthora nicotianae CJ01A1]|uniref:PiggyBac transposable element-derived protein domain-containing protein n=1 Tax=Phytophthora nicotianae CJ01A1 TaxID=1317063 RepID=W2XL63_PHYNI|nr:hypothetical protein F441_03678 [Phytophthora nicotianae CJ01A1]